MFCGISFALSIVLDFGLFALRTICCACPALFHIPGCWPLPSDILTAMGTGRARGRGKPECSSFSLPLAISLTVDASPPWLSHPLGRPPWLQLLMGDPGPWIAETTFSLCPFSLLVGAASIYCSSLWVFFPVSWKWWGGAGGGAWGWGGGGEREREGWQGSNAIWDGLRMGWREWLAARPYMFSVWCWTPRATVKQLRCHRQLESTLNFSFWAPFFLEYGSPKLD